MDRVSSVAIIMAVIVVAVASQTAAQQTCPPPSPSPPALPTRIDVNLLNLDGSNINTTLLLTVDYLDADLCPQSINSVDNAGPGSSSTVFWDIYNGVSNLYTQPPAKGGTNITITVEGYEPFNITAVEGGNVNGDYNLPRIPEVDINLLDMDGSNIDTTLLLTLCYYQDSGSALQCVNSTKFGSPGFLEWRWGIYNGTSNLFARPAVKNGTNITIEIDGYEPLNITVSNGSVRGNYSLPDNIPPYNTTNPDYAPYVFINKPWDISITWADNETSVDTAWLVRNTEGVKYFPDMNVTDGSEIEFFWNTYTETNPGEINITAYANDTNGNTNQIPSFTYRVIDTIEIVLESPEQDIYYNTANILINGTVFPSTTTANISYSLNNKNNISIRNNATNFSIWINETEGIKEGLNSLTVYAVNYYNGNDTDSDTRLFYVDTTYPDISHNPNTTPPGAHSQNWIFVNVSVNDTYLNTIILELIGPSGTNFTSWDGNDSINYWKNVTNLTDGQYTIRVYASDLAGNTDVTVPPRNITLDTVPPDIVVELPDGFPSSYPINGESVRLIYHVFDKTTTVSWHGTSLDGGANISGNRTLDRLPDGLHNITIYANDTAGNMNSSKGRVTVNNGIQDSYTGSIVNNTFTCSNMYSSGRCGIEINITEGNMSSAQLNITRFRFTNLSQAPDTINPLNLSDGYVTTGIYIRINSNLTNFSSALLRIYYNTSTDLDTNGDGKPGTPGDIDPATLRIYRYNETNKTWYMLKSRVNLTSDIQGYDGYIEVNITNFSYFSYAGGLILPLPPKRPGGGSSPYRVYVPEYIPTVILTSSSDWHYAMLAAGFAAANDYGVLVNPSRTLELAVKNNIQWFRRLVILGDESVISEDIEDNITYLKESLEPGFFGMDIVRVNGSGYYDSSALLVDRWRDPKGNLTAKGIIITRADVFTDTLVASQLSGATSSPIIYTFQTRLSPWAKDKIQELGLDVTIIGGEEAISPEVEEEIKSLGVNVTRIGGKDRYETAALVAEEYVKVMKDKGKPVDTITFLSGENGEWASTLGAWSYEQNSVILLVKNSSRTDEFPDVNKNFIATHPEITSASIWVESDENIDDFASTISYLRSIDYHVDPNKGNSYQMNRGTMEKDYTIQLNPVSLSTSLTGDIARRLSNKGKMFMSSTGGAGGGGIGGGDSGKYESDPS